jgi:TIR domain
MSEIFISYARPDRDIARKLATYLVDHGLSVWWDMSLKPGEVFRDEIERRIRTARHVIVIWSKTSVKSHFVLDEAGEARDQAKLIPLRIDDCAIPLGFRQFHTHDVRNWPTDLVGLSAVLGAGNTAAKSQPVHSGDVKASPQPKPTSAAAKHDANPRQAPRDRKFRTPISNSVSAGRTPVPTPAPVEVEVNWEYRESL